MKRRVFISIFLLTFIIIAVNAGISYFALYQSNVKNIDSSLERACRTALADIKAGQEPQEIAENLKGLFDTRMSLIDLSGTVLFDSDNNSQQMENHKTRPEIVQAMEEGVGYSQRFSNTDMAYYRYVAVKEGDIIARFAAPTTYLYDAAKYLAIVVLISFLLSLIIMVLLISFLSNRLTKPVTALNDYVRGNASALNQSNMPPEIHELANTFDIIRKDLEESIERASQQNLYLMNTINSMPDGFVAVDEQDNVVLLNQKAKEIFRIRNRSAKGENILALTHNLDIYDTLEAGRKLKYEVMIEDQIYKVSACPIVDDQGKEHGSILLFSDITTIRQLETMRSNFVSNVTHELKTPLTSIRGFIDTLKNGAIKDEAAANRFLDIIDIESVRLEQLISDILELGRIESGRMEESKETFLLKEVVDYVLELMQKAAQEKEVSISYEGDNPMLYINKYRMQRLLLNLVDNAVNYNHPGGTVAITSKQNGENLILKVRDTGMGIEPEELPHVFERFYKSERTLQVNSKSTGLGLSIVKHIAELYGGYVTVESQVGVGTEFTVTLPVVQTKRS